MPRGKPQLVCQVAHERISAIALVSPEKAGLFSEMTPMRLIQAGVLAAAAFVGGRLVADEGMWLFGAPPLQQLKERHAFIPSPAWLEHVQRSAVRIYGGGSGAFVSPDGLIVTNHHVGAKALQKLSNENNDYLRDGFHARTRAEEKRCLDLELHVLISTEDVTPRVNAAVKPGATVAEAFAARRAVKAEIEKESLEKTGLRSDLVTLFQGAQYHLYRYKKYTDVRLVFSPEYEVAFFGGDPDNFEFPRYTLDFCFFRAYENGQPAKVEHYLKWSEEGVAPGDLVFVAGHPGSTSRLLTTAELADSRDRRIPQAIDWFKAHEILLLNFSARNAEAARRAHDLLFNYRNSRKSYDGMLAGLLAPELFAAKRAEEERLRQAASQKELADAAGAWDEIAAAQAAIAQHSVRYSSLERLADRGSDLLRIARMVYRAVQEKTKPSGQRLREFRESNRASLELRLFSDEPLHDDLERVRLASYLTLLATDLGVDDPLVKAAFAGKSPRDRAAELVAATKIRDVAVRKQLYAGDAAALEKAAGADPLLGLVRTIDIEARAARKVIDEQTEIKEQAHAKIARVRYALDGDRVYPDANFTLRLSFGNVRGYDEPEGRVVPITTLGGMYQRFAEHEGREPFSMPNRWLERTEKIDFAVPLNFVSTCDIVGGNSGSPTLNRAGEFVGLIFDGNMHSLVGGFGYDGAKSRAISVDGRAIVESLRTIYEAQELVEELLGKK